MRAFLAVIAVLTLAPAVHAQDATTATTATPADPIPAPGVVEAQAMFRHAVELGDQDRWAEALELFRRSYALVQRPSTQFNVGFALFHLGHLREAIAIFDTYLAGTEGDTSELHAEAVRRRAEAVASLATLDVAIDPPDATLRVDGQTDPSTGATRTLTLDPGRHLVLATAPGHLEAQREVSLLSGEQHHEQIALDVDPAFVADEQGDEQVAVPLERDPVFWIALAAGVVAVGVGVGVGVGVATSGTTDPYAGSTGVVLRMP
jgi:hypothetical protein